MDWICQDCGGISAGREKNASSQITQKVFARPQKFNENLLTLRLNR
jgi:hypothetical protein